MNVKDGVFRTREFVKYEFLDIPFNQRIRLAEQKMNKGFPSEVLNEPVSADNPVFTMYVEKVLGEGQSVIVLHRYANMAGAKDYFLVRNAEDFFRALSKAHPKTSVSVFFQEVLPIRDMVSTRVETQVLDYLTAQPEADREVFIIRLDASDMVLQFDRDIFLFETADEVRTWTGRNFGVSIMAGGLPFWERNSERVITAYVRDQDGVLRPGAY